MRLIDADSIKYSEETVCGGHGLYIKELTVSKEQIDEMSTVDAVEVVYGRWVDIFNGKYANPLYKCSICEETALYKIEVDLLGHEIVLQELSDYCPNCGAKMDGGSNNG